MCGGRWPTGYLRLGICAWRVPEWCADHMSVCNIVCGFDLGCDPGNRCKWPCPQRCGRSYKNKHSLASHLRYECGVQPQFNCKNCSRTFKLKHHLKSHVMSCENVPPEYRCPFCDKLFRHKVHLKMHVGCVHKVIA